MYGHLLVSDHSSPQPSAAPGVCQNCAREDDDLVAVTRLYVQPETWDAPGKVTPTNEVELWCFSCRTQYPHEEAEPAE